MVLGGWMIGWGEGCGLRRLGCDVGCGHVGHVRPEDEVLPVDQHRLVTTGNCGFANVGAGAVQRPDAVADPHVADVLDGLGVAHVDVTELDPPAVDTEPESGEMPVQGLQYQFGGRLAGVDEERAILRLAGAASEVPGLDDASLCRGYAVAGKDLVASLVEVLEDRKSVV